MRWEIKATQHLRGLRRKPSRIGLATLAVALLLQSCSQLQNGVTVTAAPANTSTKYLDDIEWKQRTEFGRAYSNWAFLTTTRFKLNKISDKQEGSHHTFQYEITGADIKLALDCIETLPIGVKEPLRKHEDMHCQMTTECYQAATETAKKIAQDMVGQKVTIMDASDERSAEKLAQLECKRNFSIQYRVTTQNKADRLADIFDRITNHGLNGVTNEEGRQRSFEEYDRDYKPLESPTNPPLPVGSEAPVHVAKPTTENNKLKSVAKPKAAAKETVKSVQDPEEAKRLQSMGAWKNAPAVAPANPAARPKNDEIKPDASDGPIVSPVPN